MPRFPRPIREARKVLADSGVKKAPVPVDRIAKELAHYIVDDIPEDISGVLVPLEPEPGGKPWAILVNKAHHKNRQRFTLAHEIGHILMHNIRGPHADKTFKVRFRDAKSSDGTVQDEIEANQ